MNKKGYTLIEVIVSIMILSIASLTLGGAFVSVVKFMGNSNDVKNSSDDLLAYIEGTDDGEIRSTIQSESTNKTYKIHGIEVKGHVEVNTSKKSDDIQLSQFYPDESSKVSELPAFKDLDSFDTLTIEKLRSHMAMLSEDIIEQQGYNRAVKNLFEKELNYTFKQFPSFLLPSGAGNVKFISAFFPWEIYEQGKVNSGGALIYASIYSSMQTGNIDDLDLVYDYNENVWYYHERSPYKVYRVDYQPWFDKDNKENLTALCKTINGVEYWDKIKSFEQLMEEIKDPKNGWKYLKSDAVYNSDSTIDSYWVNVQ